MQVGLLWYDSDARIPFVQKVLEAAERYQEKFGRAANTCYVHSSILPAGAIVPGFEMRTRDTIRPHNFWIGFDPEAQPAPQPEGLPEPVILPVETQVRPRRKRRAA